MDCNSTNLVINATEENSIYFSFLEGRHDFANFTVNSTSSLNAPWKVQLNFSSDIFMVVLSVMMMLAMGCEVHWKKIQSHLKEPVPLVIGMSMQFILLPLFSYLVLIACGIQSLHAVGVLIITCCPGGILSNTFSYFSGGDLSLSVTMTTISTVASMGFLPANAWIYCRQFASTTLVIPYKNMSISAVLLTSPIIVGMLIKWKFPHASSLITKIGSVLGFVLINVVAILKMLLFHDKILLMATNLLFIILLLPVTAFLMGYSFAFVTTQSDATRIAIGLETGVQNVPLALTIITLSFPSEVAEEIVTLPLLYGVMMIGVGTLLCLILYCLKRCKLFIGKNGRTPIQSKLEDAEMENLHLEQNQLDVIIISRDVPSKATEHDFVMKVSGRGSLETLFRKREEINLALLPEMRLLLS